MPTQHAATKVKPTFEIYYVDPKIGWVLGSAGHQRQKAIDQARGYANKHGRAVMIRVSRKHIRTFTRTIDNES